MLERIAYPTAYYVYFCLSEGGTGSLEGSRRRIPLVAKSFKVGVSPRRRNLPGVSTTIFVASFATISIMKALIGSSSEVIGVAFLSKPPQVGVK